MRGYQCYYYHLDQAVLVMNDNYSCWAGVSNYYNCKKYSHIIDKSI